LQGQSTNSSGVQGQEGGWKFEQLDLAKSVPVHGGEVGPDDL